MKKLTRTWRPAGYTYKGKVYLLINGGSFSNSGIFASLIQEHKRGLIVGTETGGNNVILCGGENYYILPNSRIHVFKATHQMIIATNKTNTGRGVQPDINIETNLQDILLQKDVVMESVLKLIDLK
jgi:C-terminal processing protease CtpA/Prc